MNFEIPTKFDFENNRLEKEESNVAIYKNKVELNEMPIFRTTQNNIVIPTGKLIKLKGVDIRILACMSAISNVANCAKSGSNTRYISVGRVNKNIGMIAKCLGIKPKKVKEQIENMLGLRTNELELKHSVDENGSVDARFEINYINGEFITLPYDMFEFIVLNLSNGAFKTYCNLRWICFDKYTLSFEERAITQEYLLQLIGLSGSSKRAIRNITYVLTELELISIRKSYIHEHDLLGKGVTKEVIYYSIVD